MESLDRRLGAALHLIHGYLDVCRVGVYYEEPLFCGSFDKERSIQ